MVGDGGLLLLHLFVWTTKLESSKCAFLIGTLTQLKTKMKKKKKRWGFWEILHWGISSNTLPALPKQTKGLGWSAVLPSLPPGIARQLPAFSDICDVHAPSTLGFYFFYWVWWELNFNQYLYFQDHHVNTFFFSLN